MRTIMMSKNITDSTMNSMMKRYRKLFCLLWALILIGSIGGNIGIAQGKESKNKKLLIGTAPYYYKDKLRQGFKPLMQYLSDELGREAELVVTKSYKELGDKLEDGSIDIGFVSSVFYVQLKQRDPKLTYLVTAQTTQEGKKTSYYFSWLIARKDSGITKVKHFRGKSFAFTDKLSSAGYIYPQGYFRWRHLVPEEFFAKVVFAGTHEKVTDMIAKGEVETGASYDGNIWSAEERYGRIFRRIKRMGPILNPSFVAAGHVDKALCGHLITALENMPSKVQNENLLYIGFRALSKSNFTIVEDFLKTVDAPNGPKAGTATDKKK